MAPFLKQLDQSEAFSKRFKQLTETLSRNRGVPLLVAIGLTVLSLLVHLLLVLIPGSILLTILAIVVLHAAILIGFLGVVLAEPVGRG